ncbi:MAG: glycosyltransferase family 4 protein [Muribaculum sp.]|nr:glycosyltransferase family 4 protein [Muribaculum sp.]
MATRKRIALRCVIDHTWMGGVYYILNIVRSFNALPDEERPEVILLCRSEEDFKLAKEYSKYPYLQARYIYNPSNVPLYVRVINKFWRILRRHQLIASPIFDETVRGIYPAFEYNELSSPSTVYMWIADLQHKILPQFFTQKQIEQRDFNYEQAIKSGREIVFSSNDARDTFHRFYKCDKKRTHVFHFTSAVPILPNNMDVILKKYGVERDSYFLCSNQFWAHKNHNTLFEAVYELKKKGVNITVLCSGNNTDFRNRDHFDNLKRYIDENGLQSQIRILGQIPKDELNVLLAECRALIQPSLFEGWNTSVEEAKALNKYMILSDLSVHIEQAPTNAVFFKRNSPEELADAIERTLVFRPKIVDNHYTDKILDSARTLLNIIAK